ncbi:MAG: hypothetical protein LBQ54_14930 [Planctomycetaceae bacterium]|nr:hypothetical protein [Planctomycetaceae bacterium]
MNTTDLLGELNKMCQELQQQSTLAQKSTLLFEKSSAEKGERPAGVSPETAASGYTPLHQFRIDSAHPEIGGNISNDPTAVPLTPESRASSPMPSISQTAANQEKNGVWEDLGVREDNPHLTSFSQHNSSPPRRKSIFPEEESNGYVPLFPDMPPFQETSYTHSPQDFRFSETMSGYSDAVPFLGSREKTIPMSQSHTFRMDSQHEISDIPQSSPKLVMQKSGKLCFQRKNPGNSLYGILGNSLLTLGFGGIVCAGLLYCRFWLNLSGPVSGFGKVILAAGISSLLLGVIFRFLMSDRPRSQGSCLSNSGIRPNTGTVRNIQETEHLHNAYSQLIEMRKKVDTLIQNLEQQRSVCEHNTETSYQ